MKKQDWVYRANTVMVSLIVMMLVTSCAAMPPEVAAPVMEAAPVVAEAMNSGIAVGTMSTLNGMRLVLQEGSGAFIMRYGEQFMLAWPRGSAWEFVFLTSSGLPNGIKLNVFSFSDLVKQLEGSGWEYATPSSLPAAIMNVLSAGTNCLPSIFVLPAGIMPEVPVREVDEIPT